MRRLFQSMVLGAAIAAGLAFSSPALHAQHPAWTLLRDVEYARPRGRVLRLDLYLPRDAGAGPWPVVHWLHGQRGRK